MISHQYGFFALVSYVPNPLGSQLDNMTRSLPGVDFRQAHITILPPRPLRVPVDVASRHTQCVLNRFGPFVVELSGVCRFEATNFLYLGLQQGNDAVRNLHQALNTGDLAFEEQFEFQPHVTIAGPVPGENVDAVQFRAEALWEQMLPNQQFTVSELVALWAEGVQAPEGRQPKTLSWKRLWVRTLGGGESKTAYVRTTGQTS